MKEKPIIFCGAMVQAILDGRKTQTRRIVKPQPKHRLIQATDGKWYDADCINPGVLVRCHYGPGDRLWVRETFRVTSDVTSHACVQYRADGVALGAWADDSGDGEWTGVKETVKPVFTRDQQPWKPSLFMPRWASRITLELISVRAERLVNISEEDAKAEGAECGLYFAESRLFMGPTDEDEEDRASYRDGFAFVWDSLNEKRNLGWYRNPWVWRLEFRRIKP